MYCHALSCHATPCRAMPCHAISCHTIPWHVMPCRAMPSCHVKQFHAISSMSCHVMSCHATMSCHVMSCHVTCRLQNPDIPRAVRVGAHGGVAGRGRAGVNANRTVRNCSPRRQASLAPSKASKTCRLNEPPEARTSEILCKPMEEQNPRLTRGSSPVHPRFLRGLSAVYQWDEKRSFFLAADQWSNAFLSL